jgi:hypothetical protein
METSAFVGYPRRVLSVDSKEAQAFAAPVEGYLVFHLSLLDSFYF